MWLSDGKFVVQIHDTIIVNKYCIFKDQVIWNLGLFNFLVINLQCVSQNFWQKVSQVCLKFLKFATNLAISFRSCQSNRELKNEVANFTPNFVGKWTSSLWEKFPPFGEIVSEFPYTLWLDWLGITSSSAIFVDMRLWKTKHLGKRLQNLRQSCGFTVISIQSRFDTSRFDTNQSRFDTNVKSFRYTSKVDSIQTEVNSIQPLFT